MTAKDIYENCRSWLQYAETKNGFALAFSGALLVAQTALLAGVESAFEPFVLLSMLLVTFGAICCLLSFLPQDTVRAGRPRPTAGASYGIIYFGDIARQDCTGYVAQATDILRLKDSDGVSMELLQQSHRLSVITIRKLKLFYASVVISGLAIVAPLVAAGVRWAGHIGA